MANAQEKKNWKFLIRAKDLGSHLVFCIYRCRRSELLIVLCRQSLPETIEIRIAHKCPSLTNKTVMIFWINRKSFYTTSFRILRFPITEIRWNVSLRIWRKRRFSNESKNCMNGNPGNWAFFSKIEIYDWINEFPAKGRVYLAGVFARDHLQPA